MNIINSNPHERVLNAGLTINVNTIYQAPSNGFLYINWEDTNAGNSGKVSEIDVYSDSNTSPTTLVMQSKHYNQGGAGNNKVQIPCYIPINANDYFKYTNPVIDVSSTVTAKFYKKVT